MKPIVRLTMFCSLRRLPEQTMVQVCAEKYYPYVECLYEAAAIHASDGDLVCVELDCAAALGAATSDAVAARPAALVAVATLVLCLYHYY